MPLDNASSGPISPGPSTGPASTLGEVWDASLAAQLDIANPTSRQNVLGEEFDKRIDAVEKVTGVRLFHPHRAQPTDEDWAELADDRGAPSRDRFQAVAVMERRFHREIDKLREMHPDKAEAIGAGTVWDTAFARVRKAEERSADVTRRSPFSVSLPLLGDVNPVGMAAGMFGFLQDPINVATSVLGPGGSAAKGILWNASRQAVAGAVQQAAVEPFTQAWRREAGLDGGFSQAAFNIATAGLLGGVVDAGGRSIGRAVLGRPMRGTPAPEVAQPGQPARGAADAAIDPASAANDAAPGSALAPSDADLRQPARAPSDADLQRPARGAADVDEALETAARRLPEDHPVRRAADGDPVALADLAERMLPHVDDPDGVRGALDQVRFEVLQEESIATGLHAAEQADVLARALRHMESPETEPFPIAPSVAQQAIQSVDAGTPEVGAPVRVEPPPMTPEMAAAAARLRDGDLPPMEAVALIRDRPELAAEVLPTTDTGLGIRALARLDEAAWDMVTGGEASPEFGALVAQSVPPGRHADLLQRLAAVEPRDLDAARRALASLQAEPIDAASAAALLGASEAHTASARGAVGVESAAPDAVTAKLWDQPLGEGAKRQAEALSEVEARALDVMTAPDGGPVPSWMRQLVDELDAATADADAGLLVQACKLS